MKTGSASGTISAKELLLWAQLEKVRLGKLILIVTFRRQVCYTLLARTAYTKEELLKTESASGTISAKELLLWAQLEKVRRDKFNF